MAAFEGPDVERYEDQFGDSFSLRNKCFNKIVFDFISTMYFAMILCGKRKPATRILL